MPRKDAARHRRSSLSGSEWPRPSDVAELAREAAAMTDDSPLPSGKR